MPVEYPVREIKKAVRIIYSETWGRHNNLRIKGYNTNKNHGSGCHFSGIRTVGRIAGQRCKVTNIWNRSEVFSKRFNKIVKTLPGNLKTVVSQQHRSVIVFRRYQWY